MKHTLILLATLVATVALSYAGSMTYLLTSSDARALAVNFHHALENNQNSQATDWLNTETGLRGSAVPLKTYQTSRGQFCRDYFASVQLNGETQQAFGTACRLANGQWKIVSENMVQRESTRLKFVLRAKQKEKCPHPGSHSLVKRNDAYRSPYLVDPHQEFLRSGKKRYHSDEFYRQLKQMKKNGHPKVQPRDIEKKQPSKLIKLVEYQPGMGWPY